jgi:Family of unknown function (DUF5683)
MKLIYFFTVFLMLSAALVAQDKDSSAVPAAAKKRLKTEIDTSKKTIPHDPRKATFRSAVLPGWGQAYNKKYWKIPIVWGALGTSVGFFIYNRNEYVAAREAYRLKVDNTITQAEAEALMKPKFRPVDAEAVRNYRNGVRQNVDYSVLFFLVFWGLNVVDATVDGHLKEFNVNDNLSMRINPSFVPQTKQAGLNVVMRFGK